MAQVSEAGHIVIASDEEALAAVADVPRSNEAMTALVNALTTTAQNAIESCDIFLVCSETHKEMLGRQFPNYVHKLLVAGSPRIDSLISHEKAPVSGPPYVLINTGFPLINSIWEGDTAIRAATDTLGAEATRIRVEGQRAGLAIIPSVIQWLLLHHRVVIRPHPGERAEYWQENYRDAEVVQRSLPIPWIKNSKLLVHANSTSGLEAAVMGVPTLNLDPLPAYGDINIVKQVSHSVETAEEAIKALDAFFNGGHELSGHHSAQSLFPPNGAKNTAEAIKNTIDYASLPKREFNWGHTTRTDTQQEKFTVSHDEIMEHPHLQRAAKHKVYQLFDVSAYGTN